MGWKHAIILTLLLTSNDAFGANIIRLTAFNEGTFVLRYNDKKHSQSAFQTSKVRDAYDCVDKCLFHTSCKSINYQDLGSDENTCELVAYDRNDYDTYVSASGFKHYDTGWDSLTQIKNSYYSSSCLVPSTLTCDIGDTAVDLYFTSSPTYCDEIYSYFFFKEGLLYHHCSGKQVCYGSTTMRLSNGCNAPNVDHYFDIFKREFNYFLFRQNKCNYMSGNTFIRSTSCLYRSPETEYQFHFPQIGTGNVRTTTFRGSSSSSDFWSVLSAWSNYPNSYSQIGWADDMSYPRHYYYPMIMRKQAYFEAPATGWYQFTLACRDNCVLYIGSSESSRVLIVDRTNYGEYENCCGYFTTHTSQTTGARYLSKGSRYYLEVVLVTRNGNGNLETAYKIPGSESWIRIHSRYLHRV